MDPTAASRILRRASIRASSTAGSWKADGASANGALERLIGQASGMVAGTPAVIREAIEDAVQKENLVCNVQNDRVEWRWKDYI